MHLVSTGKNGSAQERMIFSLFLLRKRENLMVSNQTCGSGSLRLDDESKKSCLPLQVQINMKEVISER
jgi:hypothetical protein